MIVSKFGGSSVIRKDAIKNIKVLAQNCDRRILVFSAIGREGADDSKLTDILISAFDDFQKDKVLDLSKAKQKFNRLKDILKVDFDVARELERVKDEFLQNKSRDFLLSVGEELTTKMYSLFLNIPYLPSETLLFFKGDEVDYVRTKFALNSALKTYRQFVTGGFYGLGERGRKTLPRGGGDLSGGIFARLARAEKYEIFTDVEGIKTINPHFGEGELLSTLSYADLNFMTSLDATVVQKECGKLLKNSKTEIEVRSCFDLSKKGTRIAKHFKADKDFLSFDEQNGLCILSSCGKRRKIRGEKLKNVLKLMKKG